MEVIKECIIKGSHSCIQHCRDWLWNEDLTKFAKVKILNDDSS